MTSRDAKFGGQPNLSVFLKGNEDLEDALLAIGEGGRKIGKGLRQYVHDTHQGKFEVEIFREPSGSIELLLDSTVQSAQDRRPPAASTDGSSVFDLAHQTRLFQQPWDIVVFSLEPEIARPLWQHRKAGFRVSPPTNWEQEWPADKKQSFLEQHSPLGLVSVEQFRRSFARLAAEIKEKLAAHIIVFNCSTFDPDDRTRNYCGVEDTPALRALKFNLALIDASTDGGISIVDVDRILAEIGGGTHVTQAFHYSPHACALIRDEFVRVMQDIGFFERRPLVMQVGRKRA